MKDIALPPTLPPGSRLDTRDLRLVLALAAARTTAGAAAVLHLTQPAVSRALLAAEDKLSVQLFDRTPRGLEPTDAGRTLLQSAARLLGELHDLEHRVRTPAQPSQRLRLACQCDTAYRWIPSTLEALRANLPGVELELATEHTAAPIAALESGEVDVALVTSATVPRGRRLAERQLFSDEVVFVVSSRSRLAARAALTRADLREYPLLTTHPPTPDLDWFNKAVSGRGDRTLRYQRIPLTEALLDFARADMGIAVVSEWVAEPHLRQGGIVAKRLVSGPLMRPWRMVWRKESELAASGLHAALEHLAPRTQVLPAARPRRAAVKVAA